MLTLWIISDGKPGHLNQSLGLAEAIARTTNAEIHTLTLEGNGFFARLRSARDQAAQLPPPHLILAAGHRTHLPLLLLGRRFHARTLVLMRPSLPACLFDLCLVPRHDLGGRAPAANVIPTIGALNRVVPQPGPREPRGLFLIGGPHHDDLPGLREALVTITTANPQLAWTLTDSRRTPAEFLPSLAGLPIDCHSHSTTTPGWLPAQLATASEVWVTPDSVSMIHEALSSGARVGLLPCPHTRLAPRLASGLTHLYSENWLATYQGWLENPTLPLPPEPLAEAARLATTVTHLLDLKGTPA